MSKQRAIAAEGRAIAARPSLCLFLLTGALLGGSVLAPSAATAAEVPPPVFVSSTDPISSPSTPQDTTTPLAFGREGQGGTTVSIRAGQPSAFAILAGVNGANEVFVYDTEGCTGEPIGEGTLEAFEDKKAGIEVVVPAGQITELFAVQTYPGESERSPCPQVGFPYYEGTVPFEEEGGGESPGGPPPGNGEATSSGAFAPQAPRIHLEPGQRANDNTPRIAGSAPGAGSVKVFSSVNCSGPVVARGSANDLAAGIVVGVADNTTTVFSASASSGGVQSACSNAVTYVEDSTPPHTRITMAPGAKTRHRKAVFRFADMGEDPLATSFQCRVNHGKWKLCHSPFKLRHLGFHRYVLRVRATDEAGNQSKPAKRGFKVIH